MGKCTNEHTHRWWSSKLGTECLRKGCAETFVLSPGEYSIVLGSRIPEKNQSQEHR